MISKQFLLGNCRHAFGSGLRAETIRDRGEVSWYLGVSVLYLHSGNRWNSLHHWYSINKSLSGLSERQMVPFTQQIVPQLGARRMTCSRKTCWPASTGGQAVRRKEKQSKTKQFPTVGIFRTTLLVEISITQVPLKLAGLQNTYCCFSSGFNLLKFCSQKEKALVGALRGEGVCSLPLVMSTCEQK